MPDIREIPPGILRDRHWLSPQQINSLYGKAVIRESLEEKAAALDKVAEFLRVTDTLRNEGISFILLKGPLLSYRLYGDPVFRYFNDLDILLDFTEIERTQNVLSGKEFSLTGTDWPGETRRQIRLRKYSHHIAMYQPSAGLSVELHWKLNKEYSLNFRELENIIQTGLSSVSFAGRSFPVLNNELELLYLVIHGTFHQWRCLKWLADIKAFLESQKIDWKRFNELVTFMQAGRLISLCNRLLKEYFPEGRLMPANTNYKKYQLKLCLNNIEGKNYHNPVNPRTILQNLYFSYLAYPGLWYKIRMLTYSIMHSFIVGLIGRKFQAVK
jgi:hypothetical protein